MTRESILDEIEGERYEQEAIGFSPEQDDAHSLGDWVSIVIRHLGLASFDGSPSGACALEASGRRLAPADPARFRKQFVVCAAVIVAALESIDRQHPPWRDWRGNPYPPAEVQSLRRDAQTLADVYGQPALLLLPGWTHTGAAGEVHTSRLTAAVLLEDASSEMVAQAVQRFEPNRGQIS